jgi:YVTN family beta-propeller protein
MDVSCGFLMTLARSLRVAAAVFFVVICVACGDTFRPVAVPITPPPPNPAAAHYVLVVNGNGYGTTSRSTFNPGSSTRIDVSGDTNLGVAQLGPGPVHAALLPNSSTVYVANQLENTISSFVPTAISPVNTTSLPTGSEPIFVHTTENGTIYAANFGTGTVAAISTANNAVTNVIRVDPAQPVPDPNSKPVAMAETPDGKKLYVVNQGTGSVTSINTLDGSLNGGNKPIPTGTSPSWAVARADNARVYVLNSGSGTVSVIDTGTDTVVGSALVGPLVNCTGQPQMCGFMFYDKVRTRLYVTNPKSTSVVVLDASTDALTQLPAVDLTTAPNSVCAGVCSPSSIAVLPDGSRAYVVSYQLGTDPLTGNPSISAGVTVFGTTANTITSTINLGSVDIDTADPTGCDPTGPPLLIPPARFRLSAVAAADGTKVYVAGCDFASTAIIRTTPDPISGDPADSLVLDLPTPLSGFSPSMVNISGVSQSGSNATYNYSLASGSPLQIGMNVNISGMADPGNNGLFSVAALEADGFTVVNASGVAASGQSGVGAGIVQQNPVFILAGP